MSDTSLIADVQRRMAELAATQAEVARACGITQPHLSKVLNKNVNPGRKTRERLTEWLASTSSETRTEGSSRLAARVARLERLAPGKRMQVMHLLETIEGILRS